jgi:hypothetical protein
MSRYPEFAVPEGYSPPEGTSEGEEFQELCTLKIKGGGRMMCVTAVGEHSIAGAQAKEDYRSQVQSRYEDSMSQSES